MRLLPIVLAAAVVVASLALSPNFRTSTAAERSPYAGDFLHEYVGGWIVRAGDRTRLYDPAYADALEHDAALVGFRLKADRFLPMVYPPAYYGIVSPLSRLPYREAAWAWTAASLASFALAMALLARTFDDGGTLARAVPATDPRWATIRGPLQMGALPVAVMFLPFVENLVSAQKATFLLLAVAAALALLRGGRAFVAGVVLGMLAVKPQLALVIPTALLAKGQWRLAGGVLVTAGALLLASMALGRELVSAWIGFLAGAGDYVRFAGGYRERLHGLYAFWMLLAGEPTPLVRVATIGTALVVIALLARLLRGPLDVAAPRFLVQFSGLVVATVLLCPHVLTYDLTILLLPMSLLGWLALRGALPAGVGRPVLWLVLALYAAVALSSFTVRAWGVQPTAPMLLALLALLAALPAEWGRSRAAPIPSTP